MEALSGILSQLDTIWQTGTVGLWLKIILVVVAIISGIGAFFMGRKKRRIKAEREAQRDSEQNIGNNSNTEDQHSQDGQSVRDRLRGN